MECDRTTGGFSRTVGRIKTKDKLKDGVFRYSPTPSDHYGNLILNSWLSNSLTSRRNDGGLETEVGRITNVTTGLERFTGPYRTDKGTHTGESLRSTVGHVQTVNHRVPKPYPRRRKTPRVRL